MKYFGLFLILMISALVSRAQDIPDKEVQIGAALMAAPEEQRMEATVYGYNESGQIVLLREGSNNTVCLGDDPQRNGFSVACYHKDMQPFMERGWVLRAEGKKAGEIFEIRENEARTGKLRMPDHPSTLHVLSGPNAQYHPEADSVSQANLRYVVYIPFATAESTGLPLRPLVPGGPWIMDPGTHRAHIMISPPPQ